MTAARRASNCASALELAPDRVEQAGSMPREDRRQRRDQIGHRPRPSGCCGGRYGEERKLADHRRDTRCKFVKRQSRAQEERRMPAKFETFAALHVPGDPVVLYNIRDVGSALAVVAAGATALATGSHPVA